MKCSFKIYFSRRMNDRDIPDEDVRIIDHCWKSLVFNEREPWKNRKLLRRDNEQLRRSRSLRIFHNLYTHSPSISN